MEKLAIDQKALAETLRTIVHQYGIDRVEKTLFEIRKLADGSPRRSNPSSARSNPCGKQNVTQKRNVQNSASVFVSKLEVSTEVKHLLSKLAKRYEKKKFLPTIGELRNFFEIHRIDAPTKFSRVTAIPYVFRYLSNLEIHEIQSMLRTNSFSGPTQLGPIAEAIRRSSKHRMNVAPEIDEVDNSVWENQGVEAGKLSKP